MVDLVPSRREFKLLANNLPLCLMTAADQRWARVPLPAVHGVRKGGKMLINLTINIVINRKR